MEATRITLVRHGETEYNRIGRYMGRLEEGLNETGRWQAARVAERLTAGPPVDVLLSSPLRRARETAGFAGRSVRLEAQGVMGFTVMDMGPWEGRIRAGVEAEDPERWRLWLTDPARVQVEGLEGIDALRRRVGAALDEARMRHAGRHVVMVTHFACVAISVLHALNLANSAYRRFPVENASLTVLVGDQLRTFNDTAHLEGPGLPPRDVAVAGQVD